MKDGSTPRRARPFPAAGGGVDGLPLSPDGFDWVYDHLGPDLWLFSTSGGTDLCTAFVGGVPTLPVYRGELQARALGAKVEAWNADGEPVIGEVGELVITEPMPSMPLRLWGDDDGSRYRTSYFEMFPGIWRHGDWIELTERGTAIISGRSDATINRGGIRMGTAEIYRAALAVDEVVDALVVDLPRPGTQGYMPLFVVLRDGVELDDDLVSASGPGSARTARPVTSPTRYAPSPRSPAPSPARRSRCRSSASSPASRPSGRSAATRSQTPTRFSPSRSSPHRGRGRELQPYLRPSPTRAEWMAG